MNLRQSHWTHAALTFFLTVLGAAILLPLARVEPESVHKYFSGLHVAIRLSFGFFVTLVFTFVTFKLLSPKLRHLRYWISYPPAWVAALLAWIVIAVIDLTVRFDTTGYRAAPWEWLVYGGGSVLLVGWYYGTWSEAVEIIRQQWRSKAEKLKTIALQDIDAGSWKVIEEWLNSDAPAKYDFLDHRAVADRVSGLLASGTRSVGIVGPFGAGKTSLVTWISDDLQKTSTPGCRFFICSHSCWGFETSASAVHDMLGSAISKLSEVVDTFQVDSLPEEYRKTFSSGGDWLELASNLMLRSPDPMEQFERLSGLLQEIDGTMIFIVEDLDRNDTRTFEIQEVLAFLERLKPFSKLSFILTGGVSTSQRIDYAKLCDHIDYLKTVHPRQSSSLALRLFEHCHDPAVYPHESLSGTDQKYHWNPLSALLLRDLQEVTFPQAVASLLRTPRSLRHALGRTLTAWRTLNGEIDFSHLLAINVLRFGAPECFDFLVRRWDRIHSPPGQRASTGQSSVRQAVIDDWNRTIQNVEWNPTAALQVLEFILPATEYWLVNESRGGQPGNSQQGVHQERYWTRAINESLNADEIRDQVVVRDIRAWLSNPREDSELIGKLTSLTPYGDVWEDLAGKLFANQRDLILLVCEHTLRRILREQSASACHDSQGFVHTCRFARRRITQHADNHTWLRARINDAASVSIEMVNALWHFYGNPGLDSILRAEDGQSVRLHTLNTLRSKITDCESLIAKLTPKSSATIYQLVFDPGNNGERFLVDVQSWSWLGAILLEGLRKRNVLVAANCGVLLGARVSGRDSMTVDREVLDSFFHDSGTEAINILDSMLTQLPESDQTLVKNVVGAARQQPSEASEPRKQGEDNAD